MDKNKNPSVKRDLEQIGTKNGAGPTKKNLSAKI